MRFVVTILIAALTIALGFGYAMNPLPSFFYQTLVLLLIGTIGLYFYLIDIKQERSAYFVQIYIATLFAKILSYGAYMLFVVWDDKEQAGANALFFMVAYFVFTGVEILFLYRKVNG